VIQELSPDQLFCRTREEKKEQLGTLVREEKVKRRNEGLGRASLNANYDGPE